jgi:hypothetical protein
MKRLIIYLVFASLLIISCRKILFSDDENTRVVPLKDFHAVKFSGIYNIVIIQDSANRLVITGKNDINSIDAVVIDDTLIIDDHKKMSFNTNRNTLFLHFSNLGYIATYDPVNISNSDTIKADRFYYDAIGEVADVRLVVDCSYLYVVNYPNTHGHLYFNGIAGGCTFINSYGCSIFADSLSCKNAVIDNASAGDVYINASEHIRAIIRGPGNIYYYGSPVIEIEERGGNGKLIQLDQAQHLR